MKSRLSITFALLALASAGWLLVSGLFPSRGEENSAQFAPVADQQQAPLVAATEHAIQADEPSFPFTDTPLRTGPRGFHATANQEREKTVLTDRNQSASSFAFLANRQKLSSSKISTDEIFSIDSTGSSKPHEIPGDEVIATYHAPQPAVWVDLGEASSLTRSQQDEVQIMAESLSRKITDSGLDPASPEYKQTWTQSVADSDQLFRQRYGNQAWMKHHVQAYHFAGSSWEQGP